MAGPSHNDKTHLRLCSPRGCTLLYIMAAHVTCLPDRLPTTRCRCVFWVPFSVVDTCIFHFHPSFLRFLLPSCFPFLFPSILINLCFATIFFYPSHTVMHACLPACSFFLPSILPCQSHLPQISPTPSSLPFLNSPLPASLPPCPPASLSPCLPAPCLPSSLSAPSLPNANHSPTVLVFFLPPVIDTC